VKTSRNIFSEWQSEFREFKGGSSPHISHHDISFHYPRKEPWKGDWYNNIGIKNQVNLSPSTEYQARLKWQLIQSSGSHT
jgi:hypothetical protein